jgi:hypothetical protein
MIVAIDRLSLQATNPFHFIMTNFLLWLVLFILAWPIAILALFAYPIVWVLLLPFRLIGIVFEGVFECFRNLVLLPARLIGYR